MTALAQKAAGFSRSIRHSALARLRTADRGRVALLIVGLLIAVAVRLPLLEFKSGDFFAALKPWWNTLRTLGFSAFATGFSTYNPPYLYLLYLVLRLAPDTPPVVGVKLPGLFCDFLCAFFAYRLVALRYPGGLRPVLAAIVVLLAPTMALNSAFWGQADSIYTAGLLACLYLIFTGRPHAAMLAFGLALAFKLQALFLAPFLLALFLRRELPWRAALLVPVVLFAALVPAWIAGRPLDELLNVYLYQSSQFEFITMNAPTIYTWLPQTKQIFNLLYVPMILAGTIAAFFIVVVLYEGRRVVSPLLLLQFAIISLILVPFLLPKMHERYFFPADVLTIILAFYSPRFTFVAVTMNLVSFLAYEPFLFGSQPIPLAVLALALLAMLAVLARDSLAELFAAPAPVAS